MVGRGEGEGLTIEVCERWCKTEHLLCEHGNGVDGDEVHRYAWFQATHSHAHTTSGSVLHHLSHTSMVSPSPSPLPHHLTLLSLINTKL